MNELAKVNCILEHSRRRVVIFCYGENEAVKFAQGFLPPLRSVILRRCRALFTEKVHGKVQQIEDLDVQIGALVRDVVNPFRWVFREPTHPGTSDNDGNFQLTHGSFLRLLRVSLATRSKSTRYVYVGAP
ncbi:Hypothetical protein AT6N2_L0944 [Agrobacterium tumefaciens]|nr:Hypothetical protein AT6N2_L0944 [Agrobacterium tumefaciens]